MVSIRPPRSSPVLVALLASLLALRLVWVPLHLHDEPHGGAHGQVSWSLHHEHTGHEHGHDEDGEHEPHPAADHLAQLIAREASDPAGLALLPIERAISVAVPEGRPNFVSQPDEEAPKSPPPRACRARAPPAA